ncbi:MAG TPA: energy transducer TonB [Rhizomicrobium sp.]|nr:energy transducer TonB [Rhizomicrobium sp.]
MFRKHIIVAGLTITVLALVPAASALASETKPHVDASGNNMQPAYPATALPTRESGATVVSALVKTDGTVREVRLRQSSGYADLDTAAANAVNGWKFVPGTKDGQPVDAWTNIQIVFTPPN